MYCEMAADIAHGTTVSPDYNATCCDNRYGIAPVGQMMALPPHTFDMTNRLNL